MVDKMSDVYEIFCVFIIGILYGVSFATPNLLTGIVSLLFGALGFWALIFALPRRKK